MSAPEKTATPDCPHCGKAAHPEAPACPHCGEKLNVEHIGSMRRDATAVDSEAFTRPVDEADPPTHG